MMIGRIVNYIKDDTLRFMYQKKTLNIVNYKEIKTLNSDMITLDGKLGERIIVKGENLILNKMINEEVLISGVIKSIEM